MPLQPRNDPYASHNFEVVLLKVSENGKDVKGSFSEVTGLDTEVAPIEYRLGSETTTVRKVPGLRKVPNLVLKRGVIADVTFWNAMVDLMNGEQDPTTKSVKRFDGSVVLLNEHRDEVMRWNFKRGWICKYAGPSLNAKNNEIAIETIEICHEHLSIDGAKDPS